MIGVATALLLLLATPAANTNDNSAEAMYGKCKRGLVIYDAPDQDHPWEAIVDNASCEGFMTGFATALIISDSTHKIGELCMPRDLKLSRLQRVFINYVDTHPKDASVPVTFVAYRALHDVLACDRN